MATPTEAVYAVLDAHAGLAALVGDRIYAILMPQDATLPAVTFQRISAEREPLMAPGGGNGVERARVRITAWATTLTSSQAITEQVRLAMEAATTFKVVHLLNNDDFQPDPLLYQVSTDFAVWYKY